MSTQETNRVLIIGGGAAGMMAALCARKQGADVCLIEKNEKLGKKLYITGKGRCNVCNACETEEFLKHVPRNPRFLYAALNHLSPGALRHLLESLGCPTMVERGNRVYPVSQKASDVTRALIRGMADTEVLLNTAVHSIETENSRVRGVLLKNGSLIGAGAVVLATGGLAYPVTGSTGDGYTMAEKLAHPVLPQSPALVAIALRDPWIPEVQGLSLKNAALSLRIKGKVVWRAEGELLFTEDGISGPLGLRLSSLISGLDPNALEVALDLKIALSEAVLEDRLNRLFAENGAKKLANITGQLLPRSLSEIFPRIAGVDADLRCSQVPQADRTKLIQSLKALPLHVQGLHGFDEAVITKGGVDVRMINPSTMESKLVSGLFFAGEVMDVDAMTGGYNLQIAFSTGALAGESAAAYTCL